MADLTPARDGHIVHNMADDVIRGATVAFRGEITFPPPPPKVPAIAAQKSPERPKELSSAQTRALIAGKFRKATRQQVVLLICGALFTLLIGAYAPPVFMGHF